MPWPQPSPLLILAAIIACALPASAVFGLLAAWAFRRLTEREP